MYYKLALHTMESFIKYSEKVGNNFLLCQGPGGNTSIKIDKSIVEIIWPMKLLKP